jgi:acyl-CoA hydrolase
MTPSTTLIDLIFPSETNHHGTLFGGTALAHMDKVAFIAACRHAHTDFVTASCERIDFEAPAHMSEIVEVTGNVVRTGRRSLCIEAELVAESLLTGERRLCSRGRFNMVTSAPDTTVPPLTNFAEQSALGELRMVDLILPDQSNHRNILHGGYALAAMGKAAFVVATRHCRKTVVMAADLLPGESSFIS